MKKILLSVITLGILIGCEKSDSCDESRAIYSGNCNSSNTLTFDKTELQLDSR